MTKTAVIHCINSHASKTAKIIKRLYYSASRWQTTWWWEISPFI